MCSSFSTRHPISSAVAPDATCSNQDSCSASGSFFQASFAASNLLLTSFAASAPASSVNFFAFLRSLVRPQTKTGESQEYLSEELFLGQISAFRFPAFRFSSFPSFALVEFFFISVVQKLQR